MPTTHAELDERALARAHSHGDLPALTTADRLALRIGVALILRTERHAARHEQARDADALAAGRADSAVRAAFEHRAAAGPMR